MRSSSRLSSAIAALLLASTAVASADLIFTEAMSSGSTPDWFEITNTGPAAFTLSGLKFDDSSFSFATAASLLGVTSIAPNESIVFVEGTPAEVASFREFWGGPALTMQIGYYSGSGLSLSSGGDGLSLFSSTGTELTRVSFGAATANVTFGYHPTSYPSQAGFGPLSVAGVNGAYTSANPAANIGSPGAIPEPGSALLLASGLGMLFQWRRRRTLAA